MIGLHVTSAPREGVAVLKFLVDIASGKGGKIVDELLAAEAKFAKLEADANAALNAREAAVAVLETRAVQTKADAEKVAADVVEKANIFAAEVRSNLRRDADRFTAELNARQADLDARQSALAEQVRAVKAESAAVAKAAADAKDAHQNALAIQRRYEAWLASVEAVKV